MEVQKLTSLSARDYNMMAAMLRGTCPAIGKWSDLEFKNFFDLRVCFQNIASWGRLIF